MILDTLAFLAIIFIPALCLTVFWLWIDLRDTQRDLDEAIADLDHIRDMFMPDNGPYTHIDDDHYNHL